MGNSCCTSTTFRFKNFVVAAYPKDDDGEPNRDALSKLESYVLSNPERIPRVCRKISKLVAYDVGKGNVKRAGVGVQILRGLIRDANELEVFVPHVASICLLLLEKGVVEHRISAADLVTALCYRIHELHGSNMDQARRLVSDSKDRVAPFLRDMLVEGSGTNDIISLHCRFAALVALGNLANCIGPALSTLVTDLIPSVLTNLQHHLKETDMSLSSRVNQRRRQRASNVSASHIELADIKPLQSVVLPVEASEKDVAYYKGCVAAVAALAGACTQAALMPFLHTVAHFCSSYHGWSLPRFAPLVYRAIAVAIQRKPQVIGVNVCVHLCEVAEESVGTDRFPSVLRSLSAVLPHVPMTGGRPAAVIELIRSSLVSGAMFPASMISSTVREEDRAGVAEQNRAAIVELSKTLVHQIAAQGNTPQLTRIARELCSLVGRVTMTPLLKLIFDVVLQLAPFVVEVQADDDVALRHSNLVMATVAPFLLGSDRELRVSAMRIVTAMIAQDTPLASSLSSAASTSGTAPSGAADGGSAELSSVFNNTVEDVKDYVCQWTFNADHTPQTVVEVANVMTSLLFRLRWQALTFVLPWIVAVQQRSSSTATSPSRTDASGGATSADVAPPHFPSSTDGHASALQQAWLFAAVAVLKAAGDHLNIPKLSQYARDVISRRLETQPSEIGMWFNSTLYNCTSTSSGMTFVDGERDTYLAPIDTPPVTNLITVRTALVYLSQPPGDKKLMAAFQARDITEVEQRVHQFALDIGHPQQRRSSSPATKVTPRMPTVASYSVLWKRDDSTTSPSSVGLLAPGGLAGLANSTGTAMVLQIRPLAKYLQEIHGGDFLSSSSTERTSGEKFAEVARRSKTQPRPVEAIVSAHMSTGGGTTKGLPSPTTLPAPKTPHTATALTSRPATSLNNSFFLSSTTPFDPMSRNSVVLNNSVVLPSAKARRLQRREGGISDGHASPFRVVVTDSRNPGHHRCDPVINYLEL